MKYTKYKGKNIQKYSTGGIIGDTLSGLGSGAGIGASIGMIGSPAGAGIGAAIGGGVGLIGGLIKGLFTNSAEKKRQEEQARKELIVRNQQSALEDNEQLQNYATNGYEVNNLYSKGGIVKTNKNNKTNRTAKQIAYDKYIANKYKQSKNKLASNSNDKFDINDYKTNETQLSPLTRFVNGSLVGLNQISRGIGSAIFPNNNQVQSLGNYFKGIGNSGTASPEELNSIYGNSPKLSDNANPETLINALAVAVPAVRGGEFASELSGAYNSGLKNIAGKIGSKFQEAVSPAIDAISHNTNVIKNGINPTTTELKSSVFNKITDNNNPEVISKLQELYRKELVNQLPGASESIIDEQSKRGFVDWAANNNISKEIYDVKPKITPITTSNKFNAKSAIELVPYQQYYYRNIKGTQADRGIDNFLESINTDNTIRTAINNEMKQGFSQGGQIPNVKTPAIKTKVGAGIEVSGIPGKDNIPAKVGNKNIKLDNNEIVVKYKGRNVVISDDLGEADKYRAEIANGDNPKEVSNKYAQRAIILKNKYNNNKFSTGGDIPWNNTPNNNIPNNDSINTIDSLHQIYPISNMQLDNYGSWIYDIGRMPTGIGRVGYDALTNPNRQSNYVSINNIPNSSSVETPIANNVVNHPTYNLNNMDNKSIASPITPSLDNPNFNYKMPDTEMYNPNAGSFMSSHGTAIAQGASTLGSIISNISASNRLKKINVPEPVLQKFIPRDVNANQSIFNNEENSVYRNIDELNTNILNNTSNSNVALARINATKGKEINAINNITSSQIADRNKIANANTRGMNIIGARNNRLVNNYNNNVYSRDIGNVQTDLALTGSTLNSINGIINNMQKEKYQNDYLKSIAQQLGYKVDGKFDFSKFTSFEKEQLAKQLAQYLGKH